MVSLASYGLKQQSSRIAHKRAKPDCSYNAYDDAYVISTSVPTSSLLQTYDLMLLSHLENHIPLLPVPKTPHINNEADHTLLAKSMHYCRLANSALPTISGHSPNLPKVLIILGELGLPY